MNLIQRIGRKHYYARLFRKHRLEIDHLTALLADDRSVYTLRCILSAYTAILHSPYNHLSKASASICSEYHFTAKDGYRVYGTKNPYFLKDIFDFPDSMVFLDGGAYIGDTIKLMHQVTKGQYRYIYAFEPNAESYKKLQRVAQKIAGKISIFPYGLDNKSGTVHFLKNDAGSKVTEEGNAVIQVIDAGVFLNSVQELPPTFIKLDIEGKEREVLSSMSAFIQNHRPDLAISIYHKLEDLWQIPLMLHDLVPEYQLYLRHQSNYYTETMCYATVKERIRNPEGEWLCC